MDFAALLFSFDGRINRARYWLGILIMIIAAVILYFVLRLFLPLGLLVLVLTALMLYPGAALIVKRLHDHGQPAMPLTAVFLAPSIVSAILTFLGLTMTVTMMGDIPVVTPNTLGWIVNIISLAIGLYALYLLGIKKGQETDNEYGPNPLAASA